MRGNHSVQVEGLLRRAGWQRGRRVDLAPWQSSPTRPFPAARDVLTEFGGLVVGEAGPGVDVAKSDVDLRPKAYNLEFDGEPDLEREVGQRLYPIATAYEGNGEVWIDESGRVYLEGDFPDGRQLQYLGPSFAAALEVLLLGRRRPQQ